MALKPLIKTQQINRLSGNPRPTSRLGISVSHRLLFRMFESILGTWLSFFLIFISTWWTGLAARQAAHQPTATLNLTSARTHQRSCTVSKCLDVGATPLEAMERVAC